MRYLLMHLFFAITHASTSSLQKDDTLRCIKTRVWCPKKKSSIHCFFMTQIISNINWRFDVKCHIFLFHDISLRCCDYHILLMILSCRLLFMTCTLAYWHLRFHLFVMLYSQWALLINSRIGSFLYFHTSLAFLNIERVPILNDGTLGAIRVFFFILNITLHVMVIRRKSFITVYPRQKSFISCLRFQKL